MTKTEININARCVECRDLIPDDWLFETDNLGSWICGDCVNASLTLTPIDDAVEYLQTEEGTK